MNLRCYSEEVAAPASRSDAHETYSRVSTPLLIVAVRSLSPSAPPTVRETEYSLIREHDATYIKLVRGTGDFLTRIDIVQRHPL
ncbi:hypothetical protein GCM10009006_33460 [Haloarcula argentinensis]|uniref:Uncharacterized protein n=1 Tax=Haloarcula argentinensis TaxID=43776 RepID=A0A830FRD3_HALAR|nr:hypothetical protein GCM10009006_33460 [Haloarcula argentinensis]